MSRIRANTIVNGAGTGAPNFPRGAIISGISTINAEISVGTGTSISSPGTNELALGTNNLERLRISGGRVGIGTTSPDVNLHIHAPNSGLSVIRLSGSAANQITYDIRQGIPGVNNAGFSIRDITNSENKFNITHTGDAQIVNGNLVFSTAGKGIDFSATADGSGTTTSEVLDDYEEGTFLPTMFGSTVAGSTTYNLQYGYYIKVGKLVHFQIRMTVASSTATGNMYIGGLPFVALNDANRGYASINVSYANNISLPSGSTWLGAYTNAGDSLLVLIANTPGDVIQHVDVDTSWVALLGGTYISNV